MIDLRLLRDVSVDRQRRLVEVGGGCCWNDVDARTQSFELAMPGGTFGDTGVAGLTLNGGIGHLIGAFGLTLDNLEAAEVVAADGRIIDVDCALRARALLGASRRRRQLRCGYLVHLPPAGGSVMTGGVLVHRLDDATDVLKAFRDLRDELPDSVTCIATLTGGGGRVEERPVYCSRRSRASARRARSRRRSHRCARASHCWTPCRRCSTRRFRASTGTCHSACGITGRGASSLGSMTI